MDMNGVVVDTIHVKNGSKFTLAHDNGARKVTVCSVTAPFEDTPRRNFKPNLHDSGYDNILR